MIPALLLFNTSDYLTAIDRLSEMFGEASIVIIVEVTEKVCFTSWHYTILECIYGKRSTYTT